MYVQFEEKQKAKKYIFLHNYLFQECPKYGILYTTEKIRTALSTCCVPEFNPSKEQRVENITCCTEFAFIKFEALFYTQHLLFRTLHI